MNTNPNPVKMVLFFPIRSSSRFPIRTPKITNREGIVVSNPTCVREIAGKSFAIDGILAAIIGPEDINNAADNKEYVFSFSFGLI